MFRIICIAIGYLFGCFQTAYLITRHKISQDIRDFGTGNMGAPPTSRRRSAPKPA